jgi:predicted small metal-binding protein
MPLIKKPGKAARKENIKREIAAGKPPKQAVAIGYSVGRQAAGKGAGEPDADERRYKAQDGLRTLQRAEEVHGDAGLMKDIVSHAKDQHGVAKRAAAMVKSAAISERQAERMKGAAK